MASEGEYARSAQLEGGELTKAQDAASEIEAQLRALAEIVDEALPTDSNAADNLAFAIVQLVGPTDSYFKVVYSDENGNCIKVWEDPPGVCRPCGPAESAVTHELPKLKTLKA